MTTSTGKTIALIIFVVLILFVVLRITPLYIAPFGMFTGMAKTFRTGVESINIWPYGFRFNPLSLFSFTLFILWIVVIVWVYRDAERRGMNGLLWALLVLIGNIIGLLIYLIVRTDNMQVLKNSQRSQSTKPCPDCQKLVSLNFTFCPHCGARLQESCPQCGKSIEANWKVCPYCGEKLKEDK